MDRLQLLLLLLSSFSLITVSSNQLQILLLQSSGNRKNQPKGIHTDCSISCENNFYVLICTFCSITSNITEKRVPVANLQKSDRILFEFNYNLIFILKEESSNFELRRPVFYCSLNNNIWSAG